MHNFRWQITRYINARIFLVFALGLLAGALLVDALLVHQSEPSQLKIAEQTALSTSLASSTPARLRIPSVSLDTTFGEPLGITESGEVEVPESFEHVGWYEHGPTPGEVGPAVVLGHVDSYEGPAVLYSLDRIDVGDEIFIDRADGTTAVFIVTGTERPSRNAFPTERVYGDIDHVGLRLITCTGSYDREVERYSHNLIVYATLKDVEGQVAGEATTSSATETATTTSPVFGFLGTAPCTLWWLLLLAAISLSWSMYEDRLRNTGKEFTEFFYRNLFVSALYVVAVFVFLATGAFAEFWWLLFATWILMVAVDYRIHRRSRSKTPLAHRNAFYASAGAVFVMTSFYLSFPCAWWPFFLILAASTLLFFDTEESSYAQLRETR